MYRSWCKTSPIVQTNIKTLVVNATRVSKLCLTILGCYAWKSQGLVFPWCFIKHDLEILEKLYLKNGKFSVWVVLMKYWKIYLEILWWRCAKKSTAQKNKCKLTLPELSLLLLSYKMFLELQLKFLLLLFTDYLKHCTKNEVFHSGFLQ